MKITVWVVSTCIPERGEKPCMPTVFGTEAEAEAYAEEKLEAEWAQHGILDYETGERLSYVGPWREANDIIAREIDDGSWGEWQITSHQVELAVKPLVWEEYRDGGVISGRSKRRIAERTITPFGAYFLEESPDDGTWWAVDGLLGADIGGGFDADWKARAAIEADFADGIREHIVGAAS